MAKGRWPRTSTIVATCLVFAVSGCIVDRPSSASIFNATDQLIIVSGTVEGFETPVSLPVEPRQTTELFSADGDCRDVTLEASFNQGRPFADFRGTVCNDQDVYVEEGGISVRDA